MTATTIYSAEQKAAWDKHVGSGYYQSVGAQAYTYLVHKVSGIVGDEVNPHTVLLIGSEERCAAFLQRMVEREVIESLAAMEPRFFRFPDRQIDNGEYVFKTLESEMDAEQFRNFIATAVEKAYYPIAAVVIFDEGFTDGKPYPFLDRILEVPQYKNGHLVKTIRPLVFNLCDAEESDFFKESSKPVSIDWRKDVDTFFDLSTDKPEWHIEHLFPANSLTMIAAPSYTGKTFFALEAALTMATGASQFLEYFKAKAVPVSYHVPEMYASLFRDYMERLGARERLKDCAENFFIRTLERDLWPLDSPEMIDSARGRYIFCDTTGYFNQADDSASYTQAIQFAKNINNLIREGCRGICGLYHPPKYSKSKKETGNTMTLENQILGSAGYGGLLRSCLGMRNLHEDCNKGLWVYCQGLKNPGLGGPFQVEGIPLKLVKKPGESLYLSELLKGNASKRDEAIALMKQGKSRREICKVVSISPNTFSKWKREEMDFDSDKEGDEENE